MLSCHSSILKQCEQGLSPVPVHWSGDDGQNTGSGDERADPGLLTHSKFLVLTHSES